MAYVSTTLDNILHHWTMDEASGTRADKLGTVNLTANGTGGVPGVTGKLNDGADLERGDTDYFSNATYSAGNTDYSFSFWVNFESLPTGGAYQQIVWKWGAVGARCWNHYIQESGGSYRLYSEFRSASNAVSGAYCTFAFSTGTWYHIVQTADISGPTFTTYINDASQSLTAAGTASTTVATGSSEIDIGSDASAGIDGILDEFTITSDIITSGEVTTLYNSGAGIYYEASDDPGGGSVNSGFLSFM